jgi:uncharacterized protein (DUF305 family)
MINKKLVKFAAAGCVLAVSGFGHFGLAQADAPGRGQTGAFEVSYLKFIIDHHYSALRMTELAAGTDAARDAPISPSEGTSPTPKSQATPPKAQLEMIKSMSRSANRMQREEILTAQRFLSDWYGIRYEPRLRSNGRQMIMTLERTAAGSEFDRTFLQLFSRHHYVAIGPTVQCVTGADVNHIDLERYCRSIVDTQTFEIDEMRHLLCKQFSICDFQPFSRMTHRQDEADINWAQEPE